MRMSNYIFSESLGELVIYGFMYNGRHYTWNDMDCVYYRDDVDDICVDYPPALAEVDRVDCI